MPLVNYLSMYAVQLNSVMTELHHSFYPLVNLEESFVVHQQLTMLTFTQHL